jgi:dienelactone hydrolase
VLVRSWERAAWNRLAAVMWAALLLIVSSAGSTTSFASDSAYGAFGPEGARLREQLWVLPGGDPDIPLRATVFRPDDLLSAPAGLAPSANRGDAIRRPLVVINHGTSDLTREAVALPVYYWLSRWFVERGYVVLLPQRRGHGATGGPLAESVGSCADPDHYRSGLIAADDIAASIRYMAKQPFIDANDVIVVGISTGGWASLALASKTPSLARAVINVAGGRGGHAGGELNAVCGASRLVSAARTYGTTARIPTLWLYSENDSYFGPDLAQAMANAWTGSGGKADLEILPPYRDDGHKIADDRAGWNLWGPIIDRFLNTTTEAPQTASATAPASDVETGALPPVIRASGSPSEARH